MMFGKCDTMTNPRQTIMTILVLFFLPVAGWAEMSTAVVKVRSFSRVPDKHVRLMDIADIDDADPASSRLKNMDITLAPKPGKQRRMTGSMVEARIKSAEPGWYGKNKVSIPAYFVIERDYNEIPESEFKKLYYAFLEKNANGRSFRVRDITIRGNRKMALGTPSFFVDDKNIKGIEGRVVVNVYAKVGTEKNQKIYVSGWVDLYDEVVCAKRDIARGEQIDPRDVRLEKKNISTIPGNIILNTKEVEGCVAKTHIDKGECLRSQMIEQAPLIRKGDVVKIIVESGLLKVVTTGVSQENGAMGEQIMVENASSKKKLAARVVDKGTVKVLF